VFDTLSADIVIVGSGVAGALIAHQLAQAGASVLVLEAGPRLERGRIVENYRRAADQWDFQAPYPPARHAPHPHNASGNRYLVLRGADGPSCEAQYIRAVGGTTWHWAGSAWRLLPNDFRLASLYGVGRDWPIGYDDLAPFYDRAEAALGVSGPNDGDDLGSPRGRPYPMDALPLSYNDRRHRELLAPHGFTVVSEPVARNSRPFDDRPTCCGSNSCMPICPTGAMYAGVVHVDKAEAAGARLVPDAVAYRLETDARDRVAAVHYFDADGVSHRVAGRRFVIAANGIETPKLLLISTDDRHPRGIANSSDQVGRNLMDHPGTAVSFLAAEPLWPGRGPVEMTSIVDHRDGPFRAAYAAKKLHLSNHGQVGTAARAALAQGFVGAALDREIRRRAARAVGIASFHELLPDPQNRVRPSGEHRDWLGIPRPEITYRIAEYTRRSAPHTRDLFARIANLYGATEVTFRDDFFCNSHLMGTVIMGAEPARSVVDSDCRTHDHDNLFLATSGVMPSSGSVNCTLTLAALSLRIADTLRRTA
jgi:choline dehydrogenase-like flavoprotein